MFNIIKGNNNFIFENNILNKDILNVIQRENNKNNLHFSLIFLICWIGGKLENLPSLLRVYLESTKKRVYSRINS